MTEQEQTKQMLKTLCDKFQCSAIDRSYMAKSCRQCEDIVEALHEAGYGDVSEYKAEIEQLKSEKEKLKIKCDDLKRLSDWQREEIKMLKAEVNKGCDNCETIKQGQVDVLKELKTRHDYAIKNMGYPWDISQQIDELIKEIEKQ